jgi:hypothetical protein
MDASEPIQKIHPPTLQAGGRPHMDASEPIQKIHPPTLQAGGRPHMDCFAATRNDDADWFDLASHISAHVSPAHAANCRNT